MGAYYHDRVRWARVISRLLAVLVIVAVAACSSQPKRVRKPGEEYLAKISIEGNTAISSGDLVRGLALHRTQQGGLALDDYQLTLDVTRIVGAYQRRGYLSVTVEPRVEMHGDAATLTFKVTEGPRAKAIIEITGLPPEVSTAAARKLIKLSDGGPFNYAAYDEAKLPLLVLVEDAGYAHAELDATVLADRENRVATLRYVFAPGPRVSFGSIEVVGATGELANVIKRRATIREGAQYSTKPIATSRTAVYGIGRFSSVRVDIDRTSQAAVVPVTITVTPATQWEARAGAGGGLDTLSYQARLRFSLSHAGWPTPLTTLGVEFRPALIVQRDSCAFYQVWTCKIDPRLRLIGTAKKQDLIVRGLDGELEGGLDYLALEAYTVEGARVRLGLDVPLSLRRIHALAGWQLASYKFVSINPAVDAATQSELRIDRDYERVAAFTQAISVDYRDNPVSPRLGAYGEFRVAEGTAIAGGSFNYLQLTPDIRGYVPLGPVVLAARVRVGVIKGDVPPTERYYAGGASSQRGFAERRLSPLARGVDANGKPITVVIGGAASFETGIELRTSFKPWGYKLGVATFLDGGDVTNTANELQLGHLHWALGFGIRPVYLPVGPIRLEVAYRLNRTGSGEPSPGAHWNYVLSVGEAF